MTDDFFRSRFAQIIDLRQPQAILANAIPWKEIEASLTQRWARLAKAVWKIEHLDLFSFVACVVPLDISYGGRPRLDSWLAVALLYLKYAFNEIYEGVLPCWGLHRPGNTLNASTNLPAPPKRGASVMHYVMKAWKNSRRSPWRWPSHSSTLLRRNSSP